MSPTPALKPNPYQVTGANRKPLQILGLVDLPVRVLKRSRTIQALVCPKLSQDAILGMDAIQKLHIALNPIHHSYFHVNDIDTLGSYVTQTYKLPPLSATPIRIKIANSSDNQTFSISDPKIPGCYIADALIRTRNQIATVLLKNCQPFEQLLPAKTEISTIESLPEEPTEVNVDLLSTQMKDTPLPKPMDPKLKGKFLSKIKLGVPPSEKAKYEELFARNHDVFSHNKEDLGMANNFEHNIKLKNKDPIYKKQFRIPEAHQQALHSKIEEWQKIGIIEPCFSRYNSPIFIVPKKDGSFRFVLDYRALNENSLEDRYTMKDVGECIGEIGRAGSTIFSTMDLTSGFWQLPLDKPSRKLTAFTCPGVGQFQYKVLSMGLKGGPGSFQRMMELTMQGLSKVIVYIDDLLVHTTTHDEQRQTLQKVFNRLRNVCLKLNPEKCEFGAVNVSYLGFRLTPKGILPGLDKLKAVKEMQPPITITQIRQFLGLCNYFRTHVKNFSSIAAPLNLLTSKKTGWKGGTLPPDAKSAFLQLQSALVSEPVMAYPRQDRPFHLIVDAATGGQDTKGGFGSILCQENNEGKMCAIAYASRSLKDHERNYNPYLAEMNAAAWAIEHFDIYLRGRKFVLYTDHKPLETLNSVHQKTLNRLQEKMSLYDFELRYKKGSEMPADVLSRMPVTNICHVQSVPNNQFTAISQHMSTDPFCIAVSKFLDTNTVDPNFSKHIHKFSNFFQRSNGLLKISLPDKELLILPNSLANTVIDHAHGSMLTGHGGIDKTVARLRDLYFWPSLINDVKLRLSECQRCQKALRSQSLQHPLQPLPLCTSPNDRIHVDLFGPLKIESGNKAHVLCITDAHTKFVELAVIPNKEAPTVARHIVNQWICRYGVPGQIFSDGGKEFCNKLLNEICNFLQIDKNKTTPAHPQCNAQAEVVNKSIKKYLATMTEKSTQWKHLIPPLAFAYNTTQHRTTGLSPAEMLYGYKPRWMITSNPDLDNISDQQLPPLLRSMNLARDMVNKRALKQTDSYKQTHDKTNKEDPLQPGQFVYLDRRMFLDENEKLADKWEGPYLVTKVFPNGSVDILRKGRTVRVNKNRLKLYTALGTTGGIDLPKRHVDARPSHLQKFLTPPPLANGDEDDNESVIEVYSSVPDQAPAAAVKEELYNEDVPPIPTPSLQSTRYGRHPMVLRSRKIRHVDKLPISRFLRKKKPLEIAQINQELTSKFLIQVNHLADYTVLDEWALPKQVLDKNLKRQFLRRKQYLQGLNPAQRNALLTGDPLFAFDPVAYEYVWSSQRPPLGPDLEPMFQHLPGTLENPDTQVHPVLPTRDRPVAVVPPTPRRPQPLDMEVASRSSEEVPELPPSPDSMSTSTSSDSSGPPSPQGPGNALAIIGNRQLDVIPEHQVVPYRPPDDDDPDRVRPYQTRQERLDELRNYQIPWEILLGMGPILPIEAPPVLPTIPPPPAPRAITMEPRIEYPPSPLHPFEENLDDVVDPTNILLPSSSSNSSIASSYPSTNSRRSGLSSIRTNHPVPSIDEPDPRRFRRHVSFDRGTSSSNRSPYSSTSWSSPSSIPSTPDQPYDLLYHSTPSMMWPSPRRQRFSPSYGRYTDQGLYVPANRSSWAESMDSSGQPAIPLHELITPLVPHGTRFTVEDSRYTADTFNPEEAPYTTSTDGAVGPASPTTLPTRYSHPIAPSRMSRPTCEPARETGTIPRTARIPENTAMTAVDPIQLPNVIEPTLPWEPQAPTRTTSTHPTAGASYVARLRFPPRSNRNSPRSSAENLTSLAPPNDSPSYSIDCIQSASTTGCAPTRQSSPGLSRWATTNCSSTSPNGHSVPIQRKRIGRSFSIALPSRRSVRQCVKDIRTSSTESLCKRDSITGSQSTGSSPSAKRVHWGQDTLYGSMAGPVRTLKKIYPSLHPADKTSPETTSQETAAKLGLCCGGPEIPSRVFAALGLDHLSGLNCRDLCNELAHLLEDAQFAGTEPATVPLEQPLTRWEKFRAMCGNRELQRRQKKRELLKTYHAITSTIPKWTGTTPIGSIRLPTTPSEHRQMTLASRQLPQKLPMEEDPVVQMHNRRASLRARKQVSLI